MLLIDSREDADATPEQRPAVAATVPIQDSHGLVHEGPFAATKLPFAGCDLPNCADPDEAPGWAVRTPTGCQEGPGSLEVRPLPSLSQTVPHG